MAASAWALFDSAKEYIGDGTIDLDSDTFICLLVTSSYTYAATHTQISDVTNELSGNGYSRQTLTGVTWSRSGGTTTFDSADIAWTASGGSITARRAIVFDDTTTSPADALLCSSLLDDAPADVTVTDGNTLTLQINASGMWTLSG